MAKEIVLTDAEVYELEKLLVEDFHQLQFDPIDYDAKENIVIINNPEIERLVNFFYEGRYSKDENGNISISFFVFILLRNRFFPNNQSVKINFVNQGKLGNSIAKTDECNFYLNALFVLEREVNKEIIDLLNQKGFKVRTDSKDSYIADIQKIKNNIEKLLKNINH